MSFGEGAALSAFLVARLEVLLLLLLLLMLLLLFLTSLTYVSRGSRVSDVGLGMNGVRMITTLLT